MGRQGAHSAGPMRAFASQRPAILLKDEMDQHHVTQNQAADHGPKTQGKRAREPKNIVEPSKHFSPQH